MSIAELSRMIEDDVRAMGGFDEAQVYAEVERRLAGVEHTRRLCDTLAHGTVP